MEKIDVGGPDECWPWTAACFEKGYGAFRVGDKQKKAHRVGYELLVEPIPDGQFICHTCDNPPCQNPDHWFLGTHADNAQDRERKGRRGNAGRNFPKGHRDSVGALNAQARLTEVNVLEIRRRRAEGEKLAVLASEFAITIPNASLIVNRKTWAHLP